MSAESQSVPAETPDGLPLPAPVAPDPLSLAAVLRIAPMRRLWYAQVVSSFGDFVALFAVMTIMTFTMHATPQQITGVQIAYMLPIAVLGIISGVFVDRWPLKPTMVSSDFIRAGLCLLLILVHNVWGFYAVLAAISVVSSVFTPAQGIAVRSAVPLHGMRSAQALMQQVMFIMRIIGAPLASLLLVRFTAISCFIIDAVSFVASGLFIVSVALKSTPKSAVILDPEKKEKTGLAKVLDDMKQGTSFIVHHAGLFFVIVAMAAAMFVLGCFGPLIAVYVRDILHASTKTFGITSAMIGVGLMAGINVLTMAAKRVSNNVLVYTGLIGIAVGTSIMAGIPHIAAAVVGLLIIGFAVGGIIVPSQTMIQEETPQSMLGRVGSTVMSLVFTAQILGLVLSGILADHISVRSVFALCAAMLVVLAIAGKVWMEPKPLSAEERRA
ncbi:MAG TPA: MFS transporter [Acidobacteriaceae bacterium]